ncbi:MAG: glycosyltransferase [Armatimonadetes bacterium]|nr:glycosyltransferase [Armatimonadota bacterium]
MEALGMTAGGERRSAASVGNGASPAGKEPLVSVIMNCYNGERFLREAVQSVLAQSYTIWELVFWDNRSTDRSVETFLSIKDERLRYFHAPHHTPLGEARNYAIQKARGELFAFLDVDDWWVPEKLERQVALFADPEVGIVCGDFWVVDENTKRQRRWLGRKAPTGWVLDSLLRSYFVGMLTLMVRRIAFEALSYGCDPRYKIIEDLDLVVRLAVAWKLECVQEPVAYYRLHGQNESRHRKLEVEEMESWLREMKDVAEISASPGFTSANKKATYLKATERILSGNKNAAWQLLWQLPFGVPFLRILAGLLVPTPVLSRWKRKGVT